MMSVDEFKYGSCYTRAHKSWHFLHVVSSIRLTPYGINYFMSVAPVAYEVITLCRLPRWRSFQFCVMAHETFKYYTPRLECVLRHDVARR